MARSHTKRKRLTDILDRKIPSKDYIANKHGLDRSTFDALLDKGTRVEMEHTSRWDVAERIALAHLNERPDYYRLLKKHVEVKEDVDVKFPSTKDLITRPGRKINPNIWYRQPGVFEKFKEMDEKGDSHKLADHFKVSKEQVNNAWKIFATEKNYKKLPMGLYHPVRSKELMDLDKSGMDLNKIAAHFNTKAEVVRKHLQRLASTEGYQKTNRVRGGNGDRSKFWTDDKLKELDKHLENPDKSPKQIMTAMNINNTQYRTAINSPTLKSKLRNVNVKRSKTGGPRWMTPEHKEALIKMDQSGKETIATMGQKLGQPAHNIQTALAHLAKTEGYKKTNRLSNRGNKNFNRFFRTK